MIDDVLLANLSSMSSPDPSIRCPAEQYLFEFFHSDPFRFVFSASHLLSLDDISIPILQAATICIGRALSPADPGDLSAFRSAFSDASNSNERELIQQSIFRGIMYRNDGIRRNSAHCLDLLIQIEGVEGLPLIAGLLDLIRSCSYSTEAHHGAIYTFREILVSGIPIELITVEIGQFFEFVCEVILKLDRFPQLIVIECARTFPILVSKIAGEATDEQIRAILHLIEIGIRHPVNDVVRSMVEALSQLFRVRYSGMGMFMEQVFVLVHGELTSGDYDHQTGALNFWEECAQFESDLIDTHEFDSNSIEPLGIVGIAVPQLLPFLWEFLKFLPPTFDPEDIDMTELAMVAANCLSALFSAAPFPVLECLVEFWRTAKSSDSYNIQTAVLLGASAIASTEVSRLSAAASFFEAIFEDLLVFTQSNDPLVAYFAFRILERAIDLYKIGFTYIAEGNVFSVIFSSSDRSPLVVSAACGLLSAICRLSDRSDEKSLIAMAFEPSIDFLEQLLGFESRAIIAASSATLSFVISFIPESRLVFCESVLTSVERLLQQFAFSLSEDEGDFTYKIQTEMCNVMAAIAKRLGERLGVLTHRIMVLLFGLIAQRRTAIYEETMIAVAAVVQAVKEEFAEFVDRLMNILGDMLDTGNPGMIGTSADVLSDLFRYMPARMEGLSEAVFGKLLSLFGEFGSESCDLKIIECLSDIVLSVPVSSEYRDQFFGVLMRKIANSKIDVSTLEGMENASELFKVLFGGFKALVEASHDQTFVSEHRNDLMRPILMFIDCRAFCPKTYLPLFGYLREIAKLADSRTKIQLNRQKIRTVLINAAAGPASRVARQAEELLSYLRHVK
jgi:hypothetical protein